MICEGLDGEDLERNVFEVFRCHNRFCGNELVNTTAEDFRQDTHYVDRLLNQDILNI
jgi:hypothetical protein